MGTGDDVLDVAPSADAEPALAARTGGEALNWHTPVRFDPALLRSLLQQHDALDRSLAALSARCARERDRDDALRAASACAGQLHELRRQESLWIYPLMARNLAEDANARRQLLNLRFVMNGLARRVLRGIDELTKAVRASSDIGATLAAVKKAMVDYRSRNESELYTLYSLMDPRQAKAVASAAQLRQRRQK